MHEQTTPSSAAQEQQSRSRRRKVAATAGALALIAAVGGTATWSAFSTLTDSQGNKFASGRVQLTNSTSGSKVFDVAKFMPGDTKSQCVTVTYIGDVDPTVSLYLGSKPDSILNTQLQVAVQRAKIANGDSLPQDCTGFAGGISVSPGGTTIANFPTAVGSGLGRDVPWNSGDTYVYKFDVTFNPAADDTYQAQSADGIAFTWQAVLPA